MDLLKNKLSNIRKNRKKYVWPLAIAMMVMAVAMVFYYFSSFSSIRESILILEARADVSNVEYRGDINSLIVECVNGKEVQVELQEGIGKYDPIASTLCR